MSRYSVSRRRIKNDCACGKPLRTSKSKYCSNKCQQEQQYQAKIPDIHEGRISYLAASVRRLLEETYGLKCSCCKRVEWEGHPIPLEVDHINGDPTDNRFVNLRFICPNCHRLTGLWGMQEGRRKLKEQGVPGRIVLAREQENGSLVK